MVSSIIKYPLERLLEIEKKPWQLWEQDKSTKTNNNKETQYIKLRPHKKSTVNLGAHKG